jgi:CheY-like chemotaxis protein
VLCLDGCETVAASSAAALNTFGITATAVSSIQDASVLLAADSPRFDVVIIARNSAAGDGLMLARECATVSPHPLNIVLTRFFSQRDSSAVLRAAGVQTTVVKPIRTLALMQAIAEAKGLGTPTLKPSIPSPIPTVGRPLRILVAEDNAGTVFVCCVCGRRDFC